MVAQRALAVGLLLWTGTTARAEAQVTLDFEANAASLGAIPDGVGTKIGLYCGAARDVTFSVPVAQSLALSSIAVSMSATHTWVGDLIVELIDPRGLSFRVFERPGNFISGYYRSDLVGTYSFSDTATGNWWRAAAFAEPNGVLPPGGYRTSAADTGAPTAMNPVFDGRQTHGTWTLRFRDCGMADQGAVTAARLTLTGVPAATADATTNTLGNIPDGPSGVPQTPGPARDVTLAVAPGRGRVQKVRVSATMTHSRVGDLVARLIAPTGQSHVLFGYTGATTATSPGGTARLDGTYEFRDDGSSLWWDSVLAFPGMDLPSGDFKTAQLGGPGSTGAVTSMDAVFAGVPSNGLWTLRLTDGAAASVGSITAASLSLETDVTPSTFADAFATAFVTPLTIAAPGVLANDTDNLGGAISAQLVSGPSSGALSLSPSGAFTYAPALGFSGVDTFAYRATSAGGPGNVATVSITVGAPTTVQPPTAFVASSIAGNRVTLRWTPPAVGPPAADYVVEGGVAPGQVLGGVAVGSGLPILSFSAPTGAYFLRVHAIDAMGGRSGPSNEIPIFVNTAAAPSAPAALTGVVNGSALGLSWRTTFAGGAPTSLQLNVAGSALAALSLPLGETFTFAGVPAGTYTFRVRALNATGASLDSNPVTLTFPTSCTGVPAAPPNFLAYATGNVVRLVWDPPTSGPAATSYVVSVGGAFTASLPLSARVFESPAPSGAYTFAVAGVNSCGTGPATSLQTVFVP